MPDKICPTCGQRVLEPGSGKWYYSFASVFSALLFLGPFGFPLLWKSSRFNLFWKIFLTVAITVLTVYLARGTWLAFNMAFDEIKKMGLVQ